MIAIRSSKLGLYFCCLSVLTVALSVPLWGQQNIDPRVLAYADMVLYNGKVLTADDQFTIVQAVAVRDGKFLARGTSSDILGLAGPNTRRIDLQGKTVVPGFMESHSHGWEGQLLKRGPQGTIVFNTLESGLEQIRKAVQGAPPGKLLQFLSYRNKYSMNVTRWDLDRVVPNNPVVISFSTYEYNLNSPGLKMFLDHVKTEDFPGVIKDPQTGEPNGMIRGLASGTFGYEVLPWPDLNELRPKELARQKRYSTQGVTTLIGRGPGASITLVRDIWAKGELPLRVRMTHEFLRDNPEPERFLKRFGNLSGLGDDWFRIIGTLSQQPDGGSSAGAILTSLPKLRPAPKDNFPIYGQNRWEAHTNAAETLKLAAKYGWKIASVHSYGDESTRLLLKAYEEASREKRFLDDGETLPQGTWIIDHNYVGTDETIALMKKLNVIPSVLLWWRLGDRGGNRSEARDPDRESQGGFTPSMGNAMVYMYGADRLSDNWSMGRRFIDAGLRPIVETTGPPLRTMEAFITRKDGEGRVWAPQEKVTRKEALWMKTRWVAYISGDEDKLGSIEEGKLADFAILDGDYLNVPEEQISDIPVVMTVVGGQVMYEAN